MAKVGAKLKFPNPENYESAKPAVLCPAERVIGLYNQDSGHTAKKIALKVRRWFTERAHQRGWAGVYFLPEVQSKHGAGCVLSRAPGKINVTIRVTKTTLVLDEHE